MARARDSPCVLIASITRPGSKILLSDNNLEASLLLFFARSHPTQLSRPPAGRAAPGCGRPATSPTTSRHRRPAIRATDLEMLSSLRFVMGAILASATLMVSALGLLSIVRLGQITTAGPTEVSRNLSFDDRTDWNQFYDADSGWRFEQLARRRINIEPEQISAIAPARPPDPAAPDPSAEPAGEEPSDGHAEPTGPKSSVASEPESKAPVHDESGPLAAPAARTPSASASLPAVIVPAELATATVAPTTPAAPGALVLTTAAAPSSAEPSQPEPPAPRITTGIPVGDEDARPCAAGCRLGRTAPHHSAGDSRHGERPPHRAAARHARVAARNPDATPQDCSEGSATRGRWTKTSC